MAKKVILLIFVFLVAGVMRFWQLTSYPVHLSIDEVAFGYNAKSILETGRDEWGKLFPLAFASVGDYKPPVNVYLTSLSIWLFGGLNEFSVRVPTAMMGVLTVLAAVFLLKILDFSWKGALFGGFWLAILPWHIHFSRGGFEAITALFFVILGTALILAWGKNGKTVNLIGGGVALSLAVWSYYAERLFVPILFLFLVFLLRKRFFAKDKKTKSQLKLFVLVVAIFAIPFFYLAIFTPAIRARAQMTLMLSEISLNRNLGDVFLILRHWLGKYTNYFDLRYWFAKGLYFTPPGYPDLGLLYLVDLPFLFLGLFSLVHSHNKLLKKVTLFWFLVGPLAASVTRGEQHSLRANLWIPFFLITIASGFEYFVQKVKHFKGLLVVYVFLLLVNIGYFFDIYTNQFPRFYSETWQYGYKQIALFACENKNRYDQIFISESFGSKEHFTSVPQEYLAFYCGGKPTDYISENPREGIFIKRPLWGFDNKKYKNTVFIAAPWNFPLDEISEEQIIKKLYFLNGELGFVFVKSDE